MSTVSILYSQILVIGRISFVGQRLVVGIGCGDVIG